MAGEDLILAITKLMNRIKSELNFPEDLNVCNVTNLFKNKGLKKYFNSYRGIFRTPVLRNILDKLIYEDEYETIDNNLPISTTYAEFERVKQGHNTVKNIIHTALMKPQPYLRDTMFTNKETSLLFNLRSQCVNEFKANFYLHSCPFCKTHSDTQEHALSCTTFRNHMDKELLPASESVNYNDIFSTDGQALK